MTIYRMLKKNRDMSYETLQLRPVTPVIGAEVEDLDLREPLSECGITTRKCARAFG